MRFQNPLQVVFPIVPAIGQLVSYATGPNGTFNFQALSPVINLNVPVIFGQQYQINGRIAGLQITNTATSYADVTTGDGIISHIRIIQGNALTAGSALEGGSSVIWVPIATGTVAVTLNAFAAAAALQVAAQSCELSVIRVV